MNRINLIFCTFLMSFLCLNQVYASKPYIINDLYIYGMKKSKTEKKFIRLLNDAERVARHWEQNPRYCEIALKKTSPFRTIMKMWAPPFSCLEIAKSILEQNEQGKFATQYDKKKKIKFIKIKNINISEGLTSRSSKYQRYSLSTNEQASSSSDCSSFSAPKLSFGSFSSSNSEELFPLENLRAAIATNSFDIVPLDESFSDLTTKKADVSEETPNTHTPNYYHNLSLLEHILTGNIAELSYLKIDSSGRLDIQGKKTNPKAHQALIKGISNIFRMAWGNIISSQHGKGGLTQEAALKELSNIFEMAQKLLSLNLIDIKEYTDLTTVNSNQVKILLSNFLKPLPSQATDIKGQVQALELQTQELQALDPTQADTGVNGAKKVVLKADHTSSHSQNETLAIKKGFHDGIHQEFGGVNEMIAVILDLKFNHMFNVPMAIVKQDDASAHPSTAHVFAKDTTPATKWLQIHHPNEMDKDSAQNFGLLSLLMGSEDAHSGNFLLDQDNKIVPIDFGRSVAADPLHPSTQFRFTSLLHLGHLDRTIRTPLMDKLLEMDPNEIDTLITQTLADFPVFTSNPYGDYYLKKKIQHIKANLIFIQEAYKAGLNLRDMMAFKMPIITSIAQRQYLHTNLAAQSQAQFRANLYGQTSQFLPLWNRAFSNSREGINNDLNPATFQTKIREAIQYYRSLTEQQIQGGFFDPQNLNVFGRYYL